MNSYPARSSCSRLSLCAAIAVACTVLSFGAAATTITSARIGESRVLLASNVFKPGEAGVELLHDYGAFALYRVDAAHNAALKGVDHTTLSNRIEFNSLPLDTATGGGPIPSALQATKTANGPKLQVVQFIGPIAREWLATLSASGVSVLQYIPNNAYIVRADTSGLSVLSQMASKGDVVQFTTDYTPYYKLDTRLGQRARAGLSAGKELDVTVQIVGGTGSDDTRAQVAKLALAPIGNWFDVPVGQAIRLHVTESTIAALAQLDNVFAVEEYHAPHRMDERQDQIIAGNFNANQVGPSAPGYVTWLTSHGFPTTASSYPTVDVSDDGVGNGNASAAAGDVVLRINGDAAQASRLLHVANCTTDALGDGVAGHGHINTSIVGGYDARAGAPYVDPLGYQRGVGVNPFVNLTHTKIFANDGSYEITNCSNTDAGVIKTELTNGAYISSNSWGDSNAGGYDTSAQAYDLATRDADSTAANNQPMIFVFAAGNDGPGASTVGSPGTAKNVITVGASENFRPSDEDGAWTDGCNTGPTGADNAMDVADFSSRGPAAAGRIKPEIIAPGTHIQGTASTDGAAYDGSGVCDKYRPSGQTVYAASTGTSHSTPAMSGAASLTAYYLKNHFQATNANYATAGVWPSAAAIKAYMMAHTTYLTGVDANDTLPSNKQGYGMPNLQREFDSTTARYVNDQQNVLSATGQTFVWTGTVTDTSKPLKIAMAFSDAPGATTGSPVVNNLDLIVTNNGNTYRGNVFNGQYSTTGGSADALNNFEAVMLPPGTSGNITLTVVAANIAGDGVPNNGDSTDQDFALVCSNCTARTDIDIQFTPSSFLVCAGDTVPVNATIYAVNGFNSSVTLGTTGLPAGATLNLTPSTLTPTGTASGTLTTAGTPAGNYSLSLTGTYGATTTSSVPAPLTISVGLPGATTLSAPSNGAYGVSLLPTFSWVAVNGALNYTLDIDDDPAFGSIAYSATVNGTSHIPTVNLNANTRYYWRVTAHNACGNGVTSAVSSFVTNALACTTTNSIDVPKAIAASGTPTVTSTLTTTQSGTIRDVDVVNLNGTHTWINDLSFQLQLGTGPNLMIMAQSCGSQDNFYLSLDDAAAGAAGGWPCPPVNNTVYPGNRYKPSNPLATLNGQSAAGTWTLTVADHADGDGGQLKGWGLNVCTDSAPPTVVAANNDNYTVAQSGSLTVTAANGVLANDNPSTGLNATVVTAPTHGILNLNPDGSFLYSPTAGYCGADVFTYQASNGTSNSSASASIAVFCPPVATADAIALNQGTGKSVLVGGANSVLANDTASAGDTISAVLVAAPAHGILTLNADGTFSYTNDGSNNNNDSFTYKACDPLSQCSATTTVSITVNLKPVAGCSVSPQVFKEGQAVSLALAGMFVDPEASSLGYVAAGQPGALTINAGSGVLSGTVAAGAAAGSPYTLSVTATDTGGASLVRTLPITVLTATDLLFRSGFENLAGACQ